MDTEFPEQVRINNFVFKYLFIFCKIKDDSCIYFIEEGKVEFFLEVQKLQNEKEFHSLKVITEGCFGFMSFFTGLSEKYKIRTLEFTKLLTIKKMDFMYLLN